MPSKALLERSWAPLGRHLGALGLVLAPQGLPQGCPGRSKNRPKIILNRSWSASWPLLPTSLPPGASRDPFWSDFRHFWEWFLVFFVMIFLIVFASPGALLGLIFLTLLCFSFAVLFLSAAPSLPNPTHSSPMRTCEWFRHVISYAFQLHRLRRYLFRRYLFAHAINYAFQLHRLMCIYLDI